MEALKEEREWGQLFSYLNFLPAELAAETLQSLKEAAPKLPGRLANQRLKNSQELDDFALWAAPPWSELARRNCWEPLLEALHTDYAVVSEALVVTPELLAHLESTRWPALVQWVEETKPEVEEGQPGWRQVFLLSQRPLPLAELIDFLDHPAYQDLARTQLREQDYQSALGLFLQAGREDFDLLPTAQTPRERALERMLARGVVERPTLARACSNDPEALTRIWPENRYPSLAQWHIQLTGESLPQHSEQRDDERERQWRTIGDLPVSEASQRITNWSQAGFLPLHRPDLFDRVAALTENGVVQAVKVESRRLHGLPADRLFFRGDRVLGHQSELFRIWSQGIDGEPRVVQSHQPLGAMAGIWETDAGLLLAEDNGLRMLGFDGQTVWHKPDFRGEVKLSSDGQEAAVTRPFGVARLALSSGEVLAEGSFTSTEAAPPRGNVFFVSMDSSGRSIDWSPDGRLLVTYRKQFAYVWEASSLELLHQLEHKSGVTRVLFWGDGLLTVGGGQLGNTMYLGSPCHWWDPRRGQKFKEFHPFGSIREAFFDGERLVTRYDSWPPFMEIFQLGAEGPESQRVIELQGDTYRGIDGSRARAVRGNTVLLFGKSRGYAITGLGQSEPLCQWEQTEQTCDLSEDGSRVFSHSEDGLVVRSLYDHRPVKELVPADQGALCRELLETLQEVSS